MPFALFCLSFLSALLTTNVSAHDFRCSGPAAVIIHNEDPGEREAICAAAQSAITYLARFDLFPQRPVVIELVDRSIDSHGDLSYGRYNGNTDRIELMTFSAISSGPAGNEFLEEPFDRVHYAGAVAHEVAHAVVESYLHDHTYSNTPQEYLAYATQLAVLPPERRARIVAAMGVGPWEEGDMISTAYMALHPGKFAVKSYLHLTSLSDPRAFVKLLVGTHWYYIQVPPELTESP